MDQNRCRSHQSVHNMVLLDELSILVVSFPLFLSVLVLLNVHTSKTNFMVFLVLHTIPVLEVRDYLFPRETRQKKERQNDVKNVSQLTQLPERKRGTTMAPLLPSHSLFVKRTNLSFPYESNETSSCSTRSFCIRRIIPILHRPPISLSHPVMKSGC